MELGDLIFYASSKKLNDLTLKTIRGEEKSVIVTYNEQSVLKGTALPFLIHTTKLSCS